MVMNDIGSLIEEGRKAMKEGDFNEAIEIFERVIKSNPENALAYNLIGIAELRVGDLAKAKDYTKQALQRENRNPAFMYNMATIEMACGNLDVVVKTLELALTYESQDQSYWSLLGQAFYRQNKLLQAINAYQRSAVLAPSNADNFFRLGSALFGARKFGEAALALQHAVLLAPERTEFFNELGCAYKAMGLLKMAVQYFQNALKLDPQQINPLINLGAISYQQLEISVAIRLFERALKIDPDHPRVHNNLGEIYLSLGEHEQALTHYEHSLPNHPKPATVESNIVAVRIYCDEGGPQAILDASKKFDALCVHQPATTYNNRCEPERALRIGYMSPDFRHHAVAQCILPVLEAHNSDLFEVYGYSNVQQPDRVTHEIEKRCHRWRQVNTLNNEPLAKLILKDKIDILVDLAGHTDRSRLTAFAHKPAPIQISWLGLNATTGLREMDYLLTDAIACPVEEEGFLTETPLRLPNGFYCYRPFEGTDGGETTPPLIEHDGIIFGSFNKTAKVSSTTLKLWSEVLKSVPDSRLVFKGKSLNSESTKKGFLDRCHQHGLPVERLGFLPFDKTPETYMSDYRRIDIHLDTTPCNGNFTTCDALWMGVPVISLSSPGLAARTGASILTQLGLEKWIAETPEQYVEIAKTVAADKKELDVQRNELRARVKSSLLYDDSGFTLHLEAAYRQVWKAWCSGQK